MMGVPNMADCPEQTDGLRIQRICDTLVAMGSLRRNSPFKNNKEKIK